MKFCFVGVKGYVSGTMYFRTSLACFVQGVSFQWGVDSPPGFPLSCLALGLGEVLQVALCVRALCSMELVLPIGEQFGVGQGVVPWVFGMPPHWLGVGTGLMCLCIVLQPFLWRSQLLLHKLS